MSAVPQKILSWLHSALTSEYRDVNRTYSDVAQTLSYNPSFALRTDVYTFENGSSALLLNLRGTLPVSFRGTTYAFPISIWVPQEYPSAGPIGFVTPTIDMAVRPGQYVSGEGKIYHPYLAGWREDRSNLSEFFSILQSIFAREPPVVAKQEQSPRQPQFVQTNGAPPPVPPLPPELGGSDQTSRQSQSPAAQQPPPPPPKPFEARAPTNAQPGGPPLVPPHPSRRESQYSSPRPNHENGYARGPQPLLRQAPQRASSLQYDQAKTDPRSQSQQYRNQQSRREPVSPLSLGTEDRRLDGFPPIAMTTNQYGYLQQGPPPPTDGNPGNAGLPLYWNGNQQAPYHHVQQRPAPKAYQQRHSQQQILQAPKPKLPEDLLTSPFETTLLAQPANVAPPPIPPNPQKDALLFALSQTLTQQIHLTHSSNLSALPPLRAQQAALTATLNAINAEMSQLNDLESLLSSNEVILHKAMRDAEKVLEDAKLRKVPNVDDVLVAPTVVAGQLYQLVAEERAIEESRGVLGKALDKGRIGGGVWAKQTRSLAREEFLKKALIKKISRGMGLVDRW